MKNRCYNVKKYLEERSERNMNSQPKAMILDLDGTLLHSDGSISAKTLDVLHECKDNGIIIVVATARFWFKAEKYVDMINPDYAILADGTQI
nr:HAD hydrolase family protein [Eubacterium sp.]